MNIFCQPKVLTSAYLRTILDIEADADPEFGSKPRTPLREGRRDATEVGIKLGTLLVETKLIESDFQTERYDLIRRYQDLEAAFEVSELPA